MESCFFVWDQYFGIEKCTARPRWSNQTGSANSGQTFTIPTFRFEDIFLEVSFPVPAVGIDRNYLILQSSPRARQIESWSPGRSTSCPPSCPCLLDRKVPPRRAPTRKSVLQSGQRGAKRRLRVHFRLQARSRFASRASRNCTTAALLRPDLTAQATL